MVDSPLRSSELSKYTNGLTTIDRLIQRNLIIQKHNNYGEPLDVYYITDKGCEYVRFCLEKRHDFLVNFFSQFISGFIVGVVTTITASLLLQWITGIL